MKFTPRELFQAVLREIESESSIRTIFDAIPEKYTFYINFVLASKPNMLTQHTNLGLTDEEILDIAVHSGQIFNFDKKPGRSTAYITDTLRISRIIKEMRQSTVN